MQRSVPWFWILLALLLLLAPTAAGRALLDVLGGLTLLVLLVPLLLGGAGLLAWQILRRRLRTCEVCGVSSLAQEACPACGTPYASGFPSESPFTGRRDGEINPSQLTIDVEVIADDSNVE
jgi:hypothetical protein